MRPADWESRLCAELRAARARAFDAHRWNCARFAHACAQAIAGRPLPFVWRGSIEASTDAALERVELRQARRGDVVLANVPEPSLGVCLGRVAAFVGRSGLQTYSMSRAVAVWSV